MIDQSQGIEILEEFDTETLEKLSEFFNLRMEVHMNLLRTCDNEEETEQNAAIIGTLLGLHTLMTAVIATKR